MPAMTDLSPSRMITLVLLPQKAMLELIHPSYNSLHSTLVCKCLEWNSMAALQFSPKHLSTHTQIPQRKGCSLLPSRLPRSCWVTCADSACLLAPTSSISHADVPRTMKGERRKTCTCDGEKTGSGRAKREKDHSQSLGKHLSFNLAVIGFHSN